MKHFYKFLFAFLFAGISTPAQNQAKKWYFGYHAALDFTTSPPQVLINSSINTFEGCASICDPVTGNILFYTDGVTVYNSTHATMSNGGGLFGNQTSTQSAIIVKQPGNNNIYYIFTVDGQGGSNGLCYSIVDMALASGQGSVTIKNVAVYATCTEKIAGIRHCNGSDVWIVTHEMGNDKWRSYLLAAGGFSNSPVISTVGFAHFQLGQGYLRASSNGKKLACAQANGNPSTLELYDFDPSAGSVSNFLLVGNNIGNPWGVEFSPDCSRLYCGTIGQSAALYQYNLCAGNPGAIVASKTLLSLGASFPCLQNGPDGKMYVVQWASSTVSIIQNPNALGTACNFLLNGLSITSGSCTTGLPTFVNSFFRNLPLFTWTVNPPVSCNSVTLSVPNFTAASGCAAASYSITGYTWIFGDPITGPLNTSTLSSPVHVFSQPGTYNVKLAVQYECGVDTVYRDVWIIAPTASLITSGVNCTSPGSATVVVPGPGAYNYTWMPGSVSGSVSPASPGLYTITVNQLNSQCVFSTTFMVNPPVPLSATVTAPVPCTGPASATVQITQGTGPPPQVNYSWNGFVGTNTITGLLSNTHTVTVTNGICTVSKTFTILLPPPLSITVSPTTSLCALSSAVLSASASGGTGFLLYYWMNSPLSQTYAATSTLPGTHIFTVLVNDAKNCTVVASVPITFFPLPTITVSGFTICEKQSVTLSAGGALNYMWLPPNFPGSAYTTTLGTTTVFTVTGTDGNGCVSDTTATVLVKNCTSIEQEFFQDLIMYPNPCNDQLVISGPPEKFSIAVSDVRGMVLFEQDIESTRKIDLTHLEPGFYFVRLRSGTYAVVKKILKL